MPTDILGSLSVPMRFCILGMNATSIYIYIYIFFLAALGLHGGEQGLLLLQNRGSKTRAQELWCPGLVATCHVGSYFPNQGSNLCPLQWKHRVLDHQGSPKKHTLNVKIEID